MSYKTQFIKIKDLPPADSFLCAHESAYLQTLRAEKRKEDWLGGRFALKVLLARESGLLPVCSLPKEGEFTVPEMSGAALAALKNIDVVKLPSGAPQVFIGSVPDARKVSISHSNGWAVAAVSEPNTFLGIDLEIVTHRIDAWARDFFHPAELAGGKGDEFLTSLWTKKEAIVKLLGQGLALNSFEVQEINGEVMLSGRALEVYKQLDSPHITLFTRPVLDGFICSVAYAPAPQGMKFGKI